MMTTEEIEEIEEILSQQQNPHRFRHTVGVQYVSSCLAMRYGFDWRLASLAGLLHDCAKHMKGETLLNQCLEHNIPVSKAEYQQPFLLHAKYGAWLAEHVYGVTNPQVLDAIRWHTTGREDMQLLEKIVFVADYIEPTRDHAPNLDKLRQRAFEDLDAAVCEILAQTLEYLQKKGDVIDETTEAAYRYYKDFVGADADRLNRKTEV